MSERDERLRASGEHLRAALATNGLEIVRVEK